MKAMITALILVGSSAMGMTAIQDGVYQGQGRWKDIQGETGEYAITVTVKSGSIKSLYIFGGQTKQYEFEVKAVANGHFDVWVGDNKVGMGYCMSVQCHYASSFGEIELEETWTFYQDNFYRIGSKRVDNKVVTWEESMAKQKE